MDSEAQLTQEFEIEGGNLSKAGDVSMHIKSTLRAIGVPSDAIRRVSIACYEAEMNVVMYARRGTLCFSVSPQRICVEVADEGEGIPDIELAMQEGYSTASEEIRELGFGAGMGLPNIKRNTDEMELFSAVDRGTVLKFNIDLNYKAGASGG